MNQRRAHPALGQARYIGRRGGETSGGRGPSASSVRPDLPLRHDVVLERQDEPGVVHAEGARLWPEVVAVAEPGVPLRLHRSEVREHLVTLHADERVLGGDERGDERGGDDGGDRGRGGCAERAQAPPQEVEGRRR